jgi:hypothetical protein
VFLFQGPTRGVISLCKHPSIHFLASGPIFEPSLVVVPSVFASESLKTKSDLNSSSGNLSRRQVKDPLGTPHVSCASLSPADCMSLGNPEFTRGASCTRHRYGYHFRVPNAPGTLPAAVQPVLLARPSTDKVSRYVPSRHC